MMLRLWTFTLGVMTGIVAGVAVVLGVAVACYRREARRT